MRTPANRPTARPAARAAAGFTILETVIALFVAMVVGFGAISLFLFSANFNAGAADRARALAHAQQLMEEYRAESFDDLDDADTTANEDIGSTLADESDRRTFTVKRKVESVSGFNSRLKKITVTVTPEYNGRWTGGDVTLMMLRASDEIGTN
jgi:Tfp pilus assembly protein PilV